ncbi:MAG: hypothetical protein WC845_02685 [Candidatus Staskawiczbacteria bacterium]
MSILNKILFTILLLLFAVAFFLYKQYVFSFLTLVVILVFSKWDQMKKLIAGNGRIEMQLQNKKEEENKEVK